MSVKELNNESFKEFVSKGNVVVDFWAEWCGPCKMLSPIVEELSSEMKEIKFGSVNVDKETELAQKFSVMSIPTLLFFKDGKQIDGLVGAMPKEGLKKRIEDSFA